MTSPLPGFLSQKDAIMRYPVLSEACLNEARRLQQIEWVRGKYKAPYYTESAIEAYISTHRTQHVGASVQEKPRYTPRNSEIPKDLLDKAAKRIAQRI